MSVTVTGTSTVRLHRLTMVAEDDGVMIGRPDIGSYALFPEEGAETLRMLDSGIQVSAVAEWYERTCGSPLDFDDFFGVLEDLQFLCADGEDRPPQIKTRWGRLGFWVFSWPAWLCYAIVTVAAIVEMVRMPVLRPSYHNLFFTTHLSVIPIVLAATEIPCILIHESYHALAGRRLGLPSTLRISRRLYYVVAETRLDSLLSVPRRKRYLPFLAGMISDVVMFSGLTLAAAFFDGRHVAAWIPGIFIAVAFTAVLRLIWQFLFYLQTDLYYVLANALRCSDLQNATRFLIRSKLRRLLGRRALPEAGEWSDRDQVMARRYAPLFLAGYAFSLGSLAWAGIPTIARFASMIFDRLTQPATSTEGILDALTFIGMTCLQIGILIYVTLRDRRAARNLTLGAST
jgi:hypothetical protein